MIKHRLRDYEVVKQKNNCSWWYLAIAFELTVLDSNASYSHKYAISIFFSCFLPQKIYQRNLLLCSQLYRSQSKQVLIKMAFEWHLFTSFMFPWTNEMALKRTLMETWRHLLIFILSSSFAKHSWCFVWGECSLFLPLTNWSGKIFPLWKN